MSHSKRITAAALAVGAIIGIGVLPASAAERDHDRGHHYGHCKDFGGDRWHHDRAYRHGHCDDFDGDRWYHDRGHHYGQDRDGFRGDRWHHHRLPRHGW